MLFFGLVFVFFFLTYVWPTRFIYEHSASRLVRIDRSTGETEILGDSGWLLLSLPSAERP